MTIIKDGTDQRCIDLTLAEFGKSWIVAGSSSSGRLETRKEKWSTQRSSIIRLALEQWSEGTYTCTHARHTHSHTYNLNSGFSNFSIGVVTAVWVETVTWDLNNQEYARTDRDNSG